MKKYILTLWAFTIVLFFSCKPAVENKTEIQGGSTDTVRQETKRNRYTMDDGHTAGINVNLDRGAKWITNNETSTSIAKMLGIVVDFTPDPTIEDYRSLYKKLATEYQSIIQKCTMTGNGLTELQNYMLPLKEKINTLNEGNLESCNKVLPDIKDYLLKFSHFFF